MTLYLTQTFDESGHYFVAESQKTYFRVKMAVGSDVHPRIWHILKVIFTVLSEWKSHQTIILWKYRFNSID